MDTIKNFEDVKANTDHGFHDGCIQKIMFTFQKKELIIEIEHYRSEINMNRDNIYLSIFIFSNINILDISNLSLDEIGYFEDSISDFQANAVEEGIFQFRIVLFNGGKISFKCSGFEYREEHTGVYNYPSS